MTREPDDAWESLERAGESARSAAYAPYSNFRVGAAIRAADGRIFAGCNVENSSYPVTACAERVALGSAVAAGARRFDRLFLCSDAATPVSPCGMCRQALSEFAPDLLISSRGESGETATWSLDELLPAAFASVPDTPEAPTRPPGASRDGDGA